MESAANEQQKGGRRKAPEPAKPSAVATAKQTQAQRKHVSCNTQLKQGRGRQQLGKPRPPTAQKEGSPPPNRVLRPQKVQKRTAIQHSESDEDDFNPDQEAGHDTNATLYNSD